MMNLYNKLLILFLLGIGSVSCSSDSPEPNFVYELSSFHYLDNKYILDKAFMINYGKDDPQKGNNINLNLISEGIKIFDSGGKIDSATGYGHLLFFEMFSYNNRELLTGRYVFDPKYNSKPFTFDSGKGFLNMILPEQTRQTFQITSGYIDVVNSGQGKYDIKFDCKNLFGEQIKGDYKGLLKYYDYSN